MPWSDYPKDIRPFSGLVQAAAEQRFGAAATVEIIAAAARDAGIRLAFQSYAAISRLYGDYVGARNSRQTFDVAQANAQRAGTDFAITAGMVARMPYSPGGHQLTSDQFILVKGRYTQDTPEGLVSGVFSHRYAVADVHTAAQIMADMQLQMEQGAGGTDLSGATLDSIVGIEWSR